MTAKLTRLSHRPLLILALVCFLSSTYLDWVHAGMVTAQMSVTARVVKSCKVTTGTDNPNGAVDCTGTNSTTSQNSINEFTNQQHHTVAKTTVNDGDSTVLLVNF